MFLHIFKQSKLIILIAVSIVVGAISSAFIFGYAEPAYAATSIKYGWVALDKNKKCILSNSTYGLSRKSSPKPIAYITDGKNTVSVNNESVIYIGNNTYGSAMALVIGDKISGKKYKDAFLTTFKVKYDIAAVTVPKIDGKQRYEKGTYFGVAPLINENGFWLTSADYNEKCTYNLKAKKGYITYTGKGKYTGTKTVSFDIFIPTDIAKMYFSKVTEKVYRGKAITPGITVKNGNKVLKKGTDYKVTYKNNKKVGTGQIVIEGLNKYGGKKTINFKIVNPIQISKMSFSKVSNQAYTKKAVKPAVTIKNGNKVLKKGTDYKVAYKNNVKLGKAQIIITGINKYTGTKTINFNIVNTLVAASVTPIKARYVDGIHKVAPDLTVKLGGKSLKKGRDYTVSYKNNVMPGTASVTITAKKGSGYTGSKTVKFKLVNIGDGVARYACRLSYSRGIYYDQTGEHGISYYRNLGGVMTCNSAMWVAWKYSGYWKRFQPYDYDVESAYYEDTSRWKYLGHFIPGSRVTSNGYKMLPGDTLRGEMNGAYHTCMYVGRDIPKDVYNKYIKNTEGDAGTPLNNADFVTAHHAHEAGPCICTESWSGADNFGSNMTVWRCIKPDISSKRVGNVVK